MTVALAYKYVAITLMIAEMNFCATRLHLPTHLPIQGQDVRAVAIFPPKFIGFAGRIDTAQYSFSFARSGRLRFITRLNDGRGNRTLREYLDDLSNKPSVITTNEAYGIATNWLVDLNVDLQKLQKECPADVRQEMYMRKPLPIFDVKWGDWRHPAVDVRISGIDGQLLRLRQETDSYSERPVSLIKDTDKLLAIPDEEFLKYSTLERSNLVVHFAAAHSEDFEPLPLDVVTNTARFQQPSASPFARQVMNR